MKRLQKIVTLFRNRRAIRPALSMLASLYADDGFFDSLGSLTDDETAALVRWCCEGAASGKPFTAVEIGTLFGFTAATLARATPPNVRIIAVDNFCWNPFALPPSHHESFARRVLAGPLADGKVALFVGTSAAWRASNALVPDLVFLDGDHSYKAAKEECLWARGAGVRYVCGHDWGHASFGVTEAVREVLWYTRRGCRHVLAQAPRQWSRVVTKPKVLALAGNFLCLQPEPISRRKSARDLRL